MHGIDTAAGLFWRAAACLSGDSAAHGGMSIGVWDDNTDLNLDEVLTLGPVEDLCVVLGQ